MLSRSHGSSASDTSGSTLSAYSRTQRMTGREKLQKWALYIRTRGLISRQQEPGILAVDASLLAIPLLCNPFKLMSLGNRNHESLLPVTSAWTMTYGLQVLRSPRWGTGPGWCRRGFYRHVKFTSALSSSTGSVDIMLHG